MGVRLSLLSLLKVKGERAGGRTAEDRGRMTEDGGSVGNRLSLKVLLRLGMGRRFGRS